MNAWISDLNANAHTALRRHGPFFRYYPPGWPYAGMALGWVALALSPWLLWIKRLPALKKVKNLE